MSAPAVSKWWYLDLAAEFPELEIYMGGWKSGQERDLLELGDRVMIEESGWLATWVYSKLRERVWAGVIYMLRSVQERARERDPDALELDNIPSDWRPDLEAWERDRRYPLLAGDGE
jgi:hypothetical protein